MDKKKRIKEYEKTRYRINMNLNAEEAIVLKDWMREKDWENASGFIKYRLFGNNVSSSYQKVINKAKEPEELQGPLKDLFTEYNAQLIYMNLRFEEIFRELKADNSQNKGLRAKVSKLATSINSYNEKAAYMLENFQVILNKMNILVKAEHNEDIRKIPYETLVKMVPWHDTQSKYAKELARRTVESAMKKKDEMQ